MMDRYNGDEQFCMEDGLCHCMKCEEDKYYMKQDLEYEMWLDEIVREDFNE